MQTNFGKKLTIMKKNKRAVLNHIKFYRLNYSTPINNKCHNYSTKRMSPVCHGHYYFTHGS